VLLERERELAELAQAAREAAAGEGGLVLILGEAGIGKSSLVRAVRGLLPANGRLLVGHCDDLGTRGPWGRSATWSARSAPS
jgi:predicted ATPase